VVRIITSTQQKFSQSNPVLIRRFSKKLQSDPVLIRPKLASVLTQSAPVLIRAHLWQVGLSASPRTTEAQAQEKDGNWGY